MTYTKEQVLEYLNGQNSLEGAINNLNYIGSDRARIIDRNNGKTLFYLGEDVKTKNQVKAEVIKYLKSQACEMSGKEELMSMAEALDYNELTLVK